MDTVTLLTFAGLVSDALSELVRFYGWFTWENPEGGSLAPVMLPTMSTPWKCDTTFPRILERCKEASLYDHRANPGRARCTRRAGQSLAFTKAEKDR